MRRPLRLAALVLIAATGATTGPAAAEPPLSASDWLSGSVQAPPRASSAWRPGDPRPADATRAPAARAPIPPVARSGAPGAVAVSRLDAADPDSAGLISPRTAGLPADLWQGSASADLARQIAATPARLPAMAALLRRLLTAQLTPPADHGAGGPALFLARADRLLDMGDLPAARDLLAQAGPASPEVFRRQFDIALLDGEEGRACAIMDATPGIAPSIAARIFCLAQSGDWSAAALVFHAAGALGRIEPARAELLRHFLDDSFVDAAQALEPPEPVTPLDFRMHEAIGQPLPTAPLPLAFARSDLRATSGWKARLEAGERLASAGVLPARQMRALYQEQRPAASGGVWERAAAMRALDAALGTEAAGAALTAALAEFGHAGMGDVLAAMLGPDLDRLPAGAEADLIRRWTGAGATPPAAGTAPEARRGEALLAAMADVDAGLDGDRARADRGLATLSALGLGADAALAAAQLDLAPQMLAGQR